MTKQDYQQYQQAIERNLKGIEHVSTGACRGCPECDLDMDCTEHQRELAEEPHFSWSACECCGSSLGGDRHKAHGIIQGTKELIHLEVCSDCLYFLNYGQLDDTSMADIERE